MASGPLYGCSQESLREGRAIIMVSVTGVETVIPASVQTFRDYSAADIQFDHRFVEIYTEMARGKLTVDYARIHDTEPVPDRHLAALR